MSKANTQPWKNANRNNRAIKNDFVGVRQGKIGRELYAKRPIKKWELVCSYYGKTLYGNNVPGDDTDDGQYTLNDGDGGWILPPWRTNEVGGWLANHSCNPNAMFSSKIGNPQHIEAVKNIETNDTITVHYGWSGGEKIVCQCGEQYCCGFINLYSYSDMPDQEGFDNLKKMIRVSEYYNNIPMIMQVCDVLLKMKYDIILFIKSALGNDYDNSWLANAGKKEINFLAQKDKKNIIRRYKNLI